MIPPQAESSAEIMVLPCASEPLVSILIPTTSQAPLLARCLRSLARHLSAEMACEIIIVLNAATDEVKALARRTQGALIVESPANLGVAGGYNRGRSLARGEYLILLHDDTEIEPRWLESLIETASSHPEAGAIGSRILYPEGSLQSAGGIIWQNATTSPPWGSAEADPELYAQIRPVDYAGTCSLLVRSATWDAIGGLDENLYPAYYVDADLCMSVRKHGQIVLFDPQSRLFHHRGASSSLPYRHFVAKRNQEYFLTKWRGELQGYEPFASNDTTSLERARVRTEQQAAALKKHWHPASKRDATASLDPWLQDEGHLKKERALQGAYMDQLETQWAAFEAQCAILTTVSEATKQKLAHKKEEFLALKKSHAELESQLKAIKQSRWWRLGVKLRRFFGR